MYDRLSVLVAEWIHHWRQRTPCLQDSMQAWYIGLYRCQWALRADAHAHISTTMHATHAAVGNQRHDAKTHMSVVHYMDGSSSRCTRRVFLHTGAHRPRSSAPTTALDSPCMVYLGYLFASWIGDDKNTFFVGVDHFGHVCVVSWSTSGMWRFGAQDDKEVGLPCVHWVRIDARTLSAKGQHSPICLAPVASSTVWWECGLRGTFSGPSFAMHICA